MKNVELTVNVNNKQIPLTLEAASSKEVDRVVSAIAQVLNQLGLNNNYEYTIRDKPRQFTWYRDAGHAWLKVNWSDLVEMGLTNYVTEYSYRSGNIVYLEEDIDAPNFIDQYRRVKGKGSMTFVDRYSHTDSFVRSLDRYDIGAKNNVDSAV